MSFLTTKTRRATGCGKSRSVESEENQKQVSLASHRPWKSRTTCGIPTFPTAPTAAGISETISGILIVVDRKEYLTPDTGQSIDSAQLERDILWILDWIGTVAGAADAAFGYDGLRRNTYRAAKSASRIAVGNYPFVSPAEFEVWLFKLVQNVKRASKGC